MATNPSSDDEIQLSQYSSSSSSSSSSESDNEDHSFANNNNNNTNKLSPPLSNEDEKILYTHINLIDKQLIEWYNVNTSKKKRTKIKNNTMYTLSFLNDLYLKRQKLINCLNKPYWLFALESNDLIRSKIIDFNDGDILGTYLKDIQLLPDDQIEIDNLPQKKNNTKKKQKNNIINNNNNKYIPNNRLILKFIFHHDNNVIKNKSLSIYIYIDHTSSTLLIDWTKTRIMENNIISFDEDCWKHGGPQMLMHGFFKYWKCDDELLKEEKINEAEDENTKLEEENIINEMETLEKGMLYIIREIIFFSVHSFHIGINKIIVNKNNNNNQKNNYENIRKKRIQNNPDRPKSLLHRLTFGILPDYIAKVDGELTTDYGNKLNGGNKKSNDDQNISILNIQLPYWLQNDHERKRLRYKFKVMEHFDLCFVVSMLIIFLTGIYYLTLYRYIGNNDGKDHLTNLPISKTKQRIDLYDKHPHEDVYDMSFL